MAISLDALVEIKNRLNAITKRHPKAMDRLLRATVVVSPEYGNDPETIVSEREGLYTQSCLGFLNTVLQHPTQRIAAITDEENGITVLKGFTILPIQELQ